MKNFSAIALILLFGSLLPQSDLSADVLIKDFFGAISNWTNFKLEVETKEELQRISIDDGSENLDSETVSSLNHARTNAYQRAKKDNRQKLNRALEKITIDENYNLGEYMDENPNLREKIIHYYNAEPEIEKKKYEKNFLYLKSQLHFLGKNNLISKFYSELGGEEFPILNDNLPPVAFTGLVIDARDFKLNPAIFPKIQNEYGADIFNKRIAHPASVQEFGMILYLSDPKSKLLEKRVGNNPYWTVPIGVTGKNKTNLTVSYEVALKILSSTITQKNLKLCKIVILVAE
ncbi:hypothetical protein [Leptospira sp. GIMC2001]|uniref:hypothetical protein n=1 Tax=Leptospira sp. GIMC2001 TaxID=1513297 RepID=UPI00234B6051|nr:hypothetical protein [Leptospira sp. GIMC2001]WCL48019.1 hypothetical protein O4O04_11890 [Leptospira sp. GIMC2001]